jgi:hypothetical protein
VVVGQSGDGTVAGDAAVVMVVKVGGSGGIGSGVVVVLEAPGLAGAFSAKFSIGSFLFIVSDFVDALYETGAICSTERPFHGLVGIDLLVVLMGQCASGQLTQNSEIYLQTDKQPQDSENAKWGEQIATINLLPRK